MQKDGIEYWGYGGDYDDNKKFSDKNFCINGLVWPDRILHPAVAECKKILQPIEISLSNWNNETSEVTLQIKSEYLFIDTEHLSGEVTKPNITILTRDFLLSHLLVDTHRGWEDAPQGHAIE